MVLKEKILKMNKYISSFIVILALVLLTNCTSQNSNTSAKVDREWMLIKFQNFSKDLMVNNKAKLDLSNKETPNRFGANMGCNKIFGQVNFKNDGSVKFSEIGSTMMYCDRGMELEDAFGKALPTMTKYNISGHYLTLSDDNGNTMKFVASDWD